MKKPKSRIGAAKGHNKGSDNPSTKVSEVAQKNVSSMSSYGPPRNYCGALEVNLKTCAKGTKLRVYNLDSNSNEVLHNLFKFQLT